MQFLNAEIVRQRLNYPDLITALAEMVRLKRDGVAHAPQRAVLSLGNDANLLLMPATDEQYTITKFVTVHPHNHHHLLPSVAADVLILDTQTGQRLAFADGETITGMRTAALSALAWRTLAPHNDGALLIIGAGSQAYAHLDAFASISQIPQLFVHSRTAKHAQTLADYATQHQINADVIDDVSLILPQVTRIVTATTSSTPVLHGKLRDDAFIAAVGAYRPTMAEIAPDLVRQAMIFVDTLEGTQAEAGDLLQANVNWQNVMPLERALDQPAPASNAPILFKSVGHALWDLAAVHCLISKQ